MATWHVEDFPGPGGYTPNIDFVKVVFPKHSIPQSTYRFTLEQVAPGPGYYNIPRPIPGPVYTIAAKKHAVIKRQGPRMPWPVQIKDYGPFGWQPRTREQRRKIGRGIITMHHKMKPKELAQIPT